MGNNMCPPQRDGRRWWEPTGVMLAMTWAGIMSTVAELSRTLELSPGRERQRRRHPRRLADDVPRRADAQRIVDVELDRVRRGGEDVVRGLTVEGHRIIRHDRRVADQCDRLIEG